VCSVCLSKLGRAATEARPGSGTCVLFFEVAAVEPITSGQSFIIPRAARRKGATPSSSLRLLAIRFFGLVGAQQS
jgi:hypothetical protein